MYKRKVRLDSPIYRSGSLWVEEGYYELLREFDTKRLLVRIDDKNITVIPKVLTNWKEVR